LDSRFRGNDAGKVAVISDKFSQRLISVLPDKCPQSQIPSFPKNKKSKTEIPSFPRRRESRSVGAETYRIKRFL
ncbi:hypothetical protein ACKLI7_10505, partial [Neisseria meningitidis]|uniref:hypothetical protein n=1 Tax=Neisseria meningitidis TaxID=487 RepID=UPI003B28AAA8